MRKKFRYKTTITKIISDIYLYETTVQEIDSIVKKFYQYAPYDAAFEVAKEIAHYMGREELEIGFAPRYKRRAIVKIILVK